MFGKGYAAIHTLTPLLTLGAKIVEFIGILVLAGFPLTGYYMFVKDDHLARIATDDNNVKGRLRGKIFRTSFFVCLGSTFAFHLILATFGEAVIMWAIISMPMVFVFNVLVLSVVMEFVNRRKIP
jgi:hypothetical protein